MTEMIGGALFRDVGIWLPLLVALFVAAYWRVWRLEQRADVLDLAREASEDFYDMAESVLSDPAAPEEVKRALYDVARAVTEQDAGHEIYQLVLQSTLKEELRPRAKGGLTTAMDQLRRHRSDLYENAEGAFRAGLAAILLGHAGFDRKMSVTVVRSARYPILMRLVEMIEKFFSGPDGVRLSDGDTSNRPGPSAGCADAA
ncbi:hypothetical protein [Afifella marina]|uniref:Uncharacterized protein n=1 Tax=Afifella marina DSM 2698 TaxID=1120955 RepID=A0A1G5MGB8_AFIMA|nr:hypothetical protein [Afifella marina]SCZ24225.1 hypothetical protein SAMN03080610_00657 [Afifella marina DSM 2698]